MYYENEKITSALFVACLSFGFITTSALAGNDEHGYSMRVYGFKQKSHSAGWYRQTTNYKNNWKVKLTKSGEGPHTSSIFWLEKAGGANVSPIIKKIAGNPEAYQRVNPSFHGKKTVMLTAQNNNISGNEYNISGYWDEETGKIQ